MGCCTRGFHGPIPFALGPMAGPPRAANRCCLATPCVRKPFTAHGSTHGASEGGAKLTASAMLAATTVCQTGAAGNRRRRSIPVAGTSHRTLAAIRCLATVAVAPRQPVSTRRSAVLAGLFLASAGANKILLRVLLVFAAPYTHLLGVLTNMLYIVTFGVQMQRRVAMGGASHAGLSRALRFITRGIGFWCIAGAGVCEGIAFILMPLFAARLPGNLLPVMSQSLLLFSMVFSAALLGKRYDSKQVLGVAVVVSGVGYCSLEGGDGLDVGFGCPLLRNCAALFVAYSFIALALCLKEVGFLRYRQRSEDNQELCEEAVNFCTALWQGLTLFILWPLNFALVTSMTPLEYFRTAPAAFRAGAAILALYLPVNLAYTFVTTSVLKQLSALAILLTNVLNVPLVSLFFCLNVPFLGATPFRWSFIVGLVVIISGLLIYNYRSLRALSAA